MKVLVIEHNVRENKCISALLKDNDVELIKLGHPDADKGLDTLRSNNQIMIDQVNATDPEAVAGAAAGMDFVVDMAEPWISPYIKKGALQANVSYVNPKEDFGFWQKFVEGKQKLQNAPTIVSPVVQVSKSRKHKTVLSIRAK